MQLEKSYEKKENMALGQCHADTIPVRLECKYSLCSKISVPCSSKESINPCFC